MPDWFKMIMKPQVKWDGKAEQEQTIPWSELSSRVRRAVTLITCREITVALLQMK